ncbi:MAG: hypothetical protein ACREQ5_07270 [Candidatus Dormibacteria bacterium]
MTPATTAADLVRSLDQADLRRRMREIEAERKALMALLRAAAARDRRLGRQSGTATSPPERAP